MSPSSPLTPGTDHRASPSPSRSPSSTSTSTHNPSLQNIFHIKLHLWERGEKEVPSVTGCVRAGVCQPNMPALTSHLPASPRSECLPVTFQGSVKRSPRPSDQQSDSERHGALFKGNISTKLNYLQREGDLVRPQLFYVLMSPQILQRMQVYGLLTS